MLLDYGKVLLMTKETFPELPEEFVHPLRDRLRGDNNLVLARGFVDDILAQLESNTPGPIDPIEGQHDYLVKLAYVSGMKSVLETLSDE